MAAFLLFALAALDDTPEKTIQGFVDALNARDALAAARRVIGSKPTPIPGMEGFPKIKATIDAAKVEGDDATSEVEVEFTQAGRSEVSHETVHLKRADGDWRIVPVSLEESRSGSKPQVIGMVAYMTTKPELFVQARRAAKKTQCLSNAKQLGLATIIYSTDHNDMLPKTSAGWKAAIMPYVKNERIFHCPDDASGAVSYFLDPRVAGKDTTSISQPAETAMIVEGTPKKTAFRHGGKCAIAYVDGHAKIVDPQMLLKARTVSLK